MGALVRDIRHGVRQLGRRPGLAAAAVLSLALGIGLNTALFSVVNAVLIREYPLTGRDRLVEIYSRANADFPQLTNSYPDYLDITRDADAFAGVTGTAYVRGILASVEHPVLVTGEAVTANYFDVLGVRVPLGRGFVADEDRAPGSAPVVVLSHAMWQARFASNASIVGKPVNLSGLQYTVIGVAPLGFSGTLPGIPTEFWVPVTMVESFVFSGVQWQADQDPGASRLDRRGTRWLFVKGRLADGRTIEQARAQVETIFARLSATYPVTNDKVTASVLPAMGIRFHPMVDRYVRAASVGLLAAVGLVLLIACANVANLLLARGAARSRELAIRAAIGASRARLIQQLLTEGLVLAAAGGALGILLAWWAGRALAGFGTDLFPIPVSFEFSIDRTVLVFASLASIATTLLFGLMPAWSSSRPELVPALKEDVAGEGRARFTMRNALVVGQLALSLVLLVSGALLGRGLLVARATDLGYDPRFVASLSFNLQMNNYDTARATAFRDRALEAVRALPDVSAATVASRLPLSPDINATGVVVPGYHTGPDDETIVDTVSVGSDYFDTIGVPIVAGRAFSPGDVADGRLVAIVNETMARRFWPDGNAVGRRLHTGGRDSTPYEVIGVARDHKVRSVGEDPRPYLHVPVAPSRSIGLLVRTKVPAEAALAALRNALLALEPAIVFTGDVSAAQVAATTMAPTRLGAMVIGAFGALALGLATVGLYGVTAYSVSRRTREVGVRMAIGATRGQVVRMILAQGVRLALIGVLLGALAAAAVGRILESLLYGVSSMDPMAYGLAAGTLLLVACAANLAPALAAARVDPLRALRSE